MVVFSKGAQYTLELGRIAPERVTGAVFIGPLFPYTPSHESLLFNRLTFRYYFTQWSLPFYRWWGRMTQATGYRTFPSTSSGSSRAAFAEPRSSKAIEDGIGWGLETDPATLIAAARGRHPPRPLGPA